MLYAYVKDLMNSEGTSGSTHAAAVAAAPAAYCFAVKTRASPVDGDGSYTVVFCHL
jgi:hypothetical protein